MNPVGPLPAAPQMSIGEWIFAVAAALGVGIGKAGLSGMSMFHVLLTSCFQESRGRVG